MSTQRTTYRLVTRSDFDGLVCAALLRERQLIDEILFVHPKDMQDGKIEITARDITTNLPYVAGCHLAFDHHASEIERLEGRRADQHIIDPQAPSTARVVFDYYGGAEAFPTIAEDMLDAVDRCDAARLSEEEILNPRGWILLNFIMDPRTGLGRVHQFTISNYDLMMQLIDSCRAQPIDKILELSDVRERIIVYSEQMASAMHQIKRCARVHGDLVVLDVRAEEVIYVCNRFLIYALYPECSMSLHVLWGRNQQNTVFALGKSILKRTATVDIGELMLAYGGGGHADVGTCQIPNEHADRVLTELIDRVRRAEKPAVGVR